MLTFFVLLYVALTLAHGLETHNAIKRWWLKKDWNAYERTYIYAFFTGVMSYFEYVKHMYSVTMTQFCFVGFKLDKTAWALYKFRYIFIPLTITRWIAFAPFAYFAKAVYLVRRKRRLSA